MPDLSAYRLTGANNALKQASVNWGNAVIDSLGPVPINVEAYGILTSNTAAANDAAWAAMVAQIEAITTSGVFQSVHEISFGYGRYEFSAPLDFNFGSVKVRGHGAGHVTSLGGATILSFTDCTGIRVQQQQTSGASTVDGASHTYGSYSTFEDFAIVGSFAGTEAEYHGIHARGVVICRNVNVFDMAGDGFYIDAALNDGNANNWQLIQCSVFGCRDGIHVEGNNSNCGTCLGGRFGSNRRWSIHEQSGLGNAYVGLQLAGTGLTADNDGVSIGVTCVSYSGNRYGAIAGQEAGASTNAPSGTTADNTWWYYIGAGASSTGMPDWSSGLLVRAGGCLRDDDTGSRNTYFGVYAENGGGKAQVYQRSMIIGGLLANWVYQNPTAEQGTSLFLPTTDGAVEVSPTIQAASGSVTSRLGWVRGNTSNIALSFLHTTYSPSRHTWLYTTGGNLSLTYGTTVTDAASLLLLTGPTTSQQFGTGAAVTGALYPTKLMVGDAVANARQMTNGTAAPVSGAHGRGEIVWNRDMAVGSPIGWACTVAGTPGTWVAMANL